jgi:hypothetical protein
MTTREWQDKLNRQFDGLTQHDQFLLVEGLLRRMRQKALFDPVEFDQQMDEMANDPDIQRELRMGSGPSEASIAIRSDVA